MFIIHVLYCVTQIMRKYMFGINVMHLYYVTRLMRKIVGPRVATKQIVVAVYSRGVTRSIYILCHRGCIVLYDLRGMCTSFYIKY